MNLLQDAMLKTAVAINHIREDESGTEMVEIALATSLLAIGSVAVLALVSTGINDAFQQVILALTPAP